MQTLLVMTILGEDRTGLVDSVAAQVARHGGNWLESRMSRLGGHFAGILRVEVPAEREQPLIAALRNLQEQGLSVVVHTDRRPPSAVSATLRTIEIVGQDRPGIVREISGALARHGVNVEELNTECASAAMSGETVFTARARIGLPPGCDVAALRKELEKIAEDLIVEISFEEPSLSDS
jgi:glycine cleavage system regulatory protein